MATESCLKTTAERTDGFTRLSAFFYNGRLPLTFKETIKTDTAQGIGGFCVIDPDKCTISDDGGEFEESDRRPGPITSRRSASAVLSNTVENRKTKKMDGGARCLVAPNEVDDEAFFKLSSSASTATLSHFEWMTAKLLFETCSHLPYFMRQYGFMKNRVIMEYVFSEDEQVDLEERKNFNPFDLTQPRHTDKFGARCSSHKQSAATCTEKYLKKCVVDIGVYESLRGCRSAAEALRKSGEEVKASFTYQLMMAVLMAQQRINFAHCDLHWDNVFVVRCDPHLQVLFQYQRRDGSKLRRIIPTHGVMPVIIDYGFAYSKALVGYYPEVLYADNHGYITYEMDDTVDVIHLLSEYANYSKSPLSAEVGLFLNEVGVKRGRDVVAGKKFRPSWEDVNRRFVCGAYQALIEMDKSRNNNWLWNTVHDSMVRASDRSTPLPYDTRIRDLKIECIVNAKPAASFIGVDKKLLEKHLRISICNACVCGTGQDRMYDEILEVILAALSKAVRISTSSVDIPVVVQHSKEWYRNKALTTARALVPPANAAADDKAETALVMRMRLDRARTHFLTSVTAGLSYLSTKYKTSGNTRMYDIVRRVLHNLDKSVVDGLLSTMYALVALVVKDYSDSAEQLCTFVKQGLCIPLKPYSSAQPCSVENVKKNTLRFLDAFDVWAKEAGPNKTKALDEISNVTLRFLSECIRKNTMLNQTSGGKRTIDISTARSNFLAKIDSELSAFNVANTNIYTRDIESAVERARSFEVDWYEIIKTQAANISMAGTLLETNVSKLRKFKNANIRDKLKSGEDTFFRFERALHTQSRPFKERRPTSTQVLVIDGVDHKASLTTLKEIQLKKMAVDALADEAPSEADDTQLDCKKTVVDGKTCGPRSRPGIGSKRKRSGSRTPNSQPPSKKQA